MTALLVGLFVAAVYVLLRGIRDWGDNRRARRERSSFLAGHERVVRARQIGEIIDNQRVRP